MKKIELAVYYNYNVGNSFPRCEIIINNINFEVGNLNVISIKKVFIKYIKHKRPCLTTIQSTERVDNKSLSREILTKFKVFWKCGQTLS